MKNEKCDCSYKDMLRVNKERVETAGRQETEHRNENFTAGKVLQFKYETNN